MGAPAQANDCIESAKCSWPTMKQDRRSSNAVPIPLVPVNRSEKPKPGANNSESKARISAGSSARRWRTVARASVRTIDAPMPDSMVARLSSTGRAACTSPPSVSMSASYRMSGALGGSPRV